MRAWKLATALFMLWPLPAASQGVCGKHADIVALLATRHAEQRRAIALTDSDWLIELFASKNGATWTLVVTNAQGISCMTAAGQNWRPVKQKPVDERTAT